MLKNVLVLLHVITAVSWFGLALVLGAVARKALGSTDSALREVGAKTVGMMGWFAVITFVLGLAALFAGGGFGAYGPVYHTSILLLLVLILVQYFVIRPAWRSIETQAPDATASRKKLAMGTGVGHLLWLLLLVLMFWNHYPLW